MSMFAVGRVCYKIAGRDAGRYCVVVDQIDDHFVLVDGDVRRRKVNVKHLEPLNTTFDIKKNAAHSAVKIAFEGAGFGVWETKPKQVGEKPVHVKKVKPADGSAQSKAPVAKKRVVSETAQAHHDESAPVEKKVAPKKNVTQKE